MKIRTSLNVLEYQPIIVNKTGLYLLVIVNQIFINDKINDMLQIFLSQLLLCFAYVLLLF